MPDIAKEYWKMDKVHALPALGPFCFMLTRISLIAGAGHSELMLIATASTCLKALACCMMRLWCSSVA